MAECLICQIIEGKVPSKKIYEDDEILAFLDYNGAARGHTYIVPKSHVPIFEQVPDELVEKIFSIANKISTALFESLNVQGTNIFIANGVSAGQAIAHFIVNIVPRTEGDGINLQWQPRQLSEEEMSTVEIKIKEGAQNIGVSTASSSKVETKTEAKTSIPSGEDNYLWKSVNKRVAR